MNVSWLINFSMAFDGSRFLSGGEEEPHLFEQPLGPLTIDASPVADGRESTAVDDFLSLARSSGIGGLKLLCSDAVGLPLPAWESDPHLDEFVLATQDRDMAWQLRSRSSTWIDEATDTLQHARSYRFEVVGIPRTPQLDAPEATEALRALLAPHVDEDWFYGAVGRALEILDGGDFPEPGPVIPWGVDEARQRLFYAASTMAGGKLTGMGGFDDWVSVDHKQLIYTLTQAFAASTRPAD